MIPNKWQDIYKVGYRRGEYFIYNKNTNWMEVYRPYARESDAKRGAAMKFNHMIKQIEKELLGG